MRKMPSLLPALLGRVGPLLLLACSGCSTNRVSDDEQIYCEDSDYCPPGCKCESDGLQSKLCFNESNPCSGTCTRDSCPEGESCRLERAEGEGDFYSCQPDEDGFPTASGTPRVGVEVDDDTEKSLLKRIRTDGSETPIGELFPEVEEPSEEPKIRQLAYDWAGKTLYGVNVGLNQDHQLFTIDVCTGQAAKVGDLRRPDNMPFVNLEGLAIDGDGQIYVSGSLDEQIYSKTLLRVVIDDGEITTDMVGAFGQTREGAERGLDVGDADRMFFVGDQLYITDTFVEDGDIFRTHVYEVNVENVGDPNPQVSILDTAFELSSIAWDKSATESVSWESTPDMPAAEGWYAIDFDNATTSKLQGLPNFDGPFAFVDECTPP